MQFRGCACQGCEVVRKQFRAVFGIDLFAPALEAHGPQEPSARETDSLPVRETVDDLPGMWEEADLIGGQTDALPARKKPVAGECPCECHGAWFVAACPHACGCKPKIPRRH